MKDVRLVFVYAGKREHLIDSKERLVEQIVEFQSYETSLVEEWQVDVDP